MPKVQGPLLSVAASGTIGGRYTFLNYGHRQQFRRHVFPANPQTPTQQQHRALLGLVQAGISWAVRSPQCSDGSAFTDQERVHSATLPEHQWHTYAISKMMRDGAANVRGALNLWPRLDYEDAQQWEATAAALTPPLAAYTGPAGDGHTPATFSAGLVLFVWRWAMYSTGAADEPPKRLPPIYS